MELAKELSLFNHVTFLMSAGQIGELKRRGLVPVIDPRNNSLEIVGLLDGNEDLYELDFQDSQINLVNVTQVSLDDDQRRQALAGLVRMIRPLDQVFRSLSTCSLSSSSSVLTRPISRPVDLVIARSVVPLPSFDFHLPLHLFLPSNLQGVLKYLRLNTSDPHRPKVIFHYLQQNVPRAAGFICNSWKGFDGDDVDEFHRLTRNAAPIRFIGPLVLQDRPANQEDTANELIQWLDEQPDASVIYIAFGSFIQLPPSMIASIAHALSQHSFIWALKAKQSPAFVSYLNPRRQRVVDWSPQRAILAHPAVSLFLTHGGWNSLMEGMLAGKILLVWPIIADQLSNAERILQWGMARQMSGDLKNDIEEMLGNSTYADKAKEVQQTLTEARTIDSKEQIQQIARLARATNHRHEDM